MDEYSVYQGQYTGEQVDTAIGHALELDPYPRENNNDLIASSGGTYNYVKGSVIAADLGTVQPTDLPKTLSLSTINPTFSISPYHVCIGIELGDQSAGVGRWKVTTGAGNITVDGKLISATTIKVYLARLLKTWSESDNPLTP